MKTSPFALFAFLATAVAAFATSPAHAKPVLGKGMDAATIIHLVGQPDEISPLKSPEGKAETWIYRRKAAETIQQTANTQAFIPAMVGFQASGLVIGKALVP